MKDHDPWKQSLRQEPPPELDQRILKAMGPELRARKLEPKGAFFFPLWQTGLVAGAMAAFAVYLTTQHENRSSNPSPVLQARTQAEMSEMVRESRLLRDLRVLRQVDL